MLFKRFPFHVLLLHSGVLPGNYDVFLQVQFGCLHVISSGCYRVSSSRDIASCTHKAPGAWHLSPIVTPLLLNQGRAVPSTLGLSLSNGLLHRQSETSSLEVTAQPCSAWSENFTVIKPCLSKVVRHIKVDSII